MSTSETEEKPVGHLNNWLAAEEARNPEWKDFEPTSRDDGLLLPEREKSATRKLWDRLVREMGANVSGARLRNYHCAGRSEIVRMLEIGESEWRIIAHVARRKTSKPEWHEICYAWLAPGYKHPVVMESLLGALIDKTPPGISLVALSQEKWLAVALSECGFRPTSPYSELLPNLRVPPMSACYALRR